MSLLFSQTETLRADLHREWSLLPFSFAYAVGEHAAPVSLGEFSALCRHLPLVFARTPDGMHPFALTGLRAGENLMLDEAGQWAAGTVPFHVRRYPFIMLKLGDDKLTLGLDPDFSAWVKFTPEGEQAAGLRLFETDGETPSAQMRDIFAQLQAFQNDLAPTLAFCAALEAHELLEEKVLNAEIKGTQLALDGFFVINEKKFTELPAQTLAEWQKKGWFKAVFAHLLSLEAFADLAQRAGARVDASQVGA